jgi:chromosome segregation ATPase
MVETTTDFQIITQEVTMSRPTALATSGIFTLFLLGALGLLFLWTTRAGANVPTTNVADAEVSKLELADYQAQLEEAQAAMAQRETQYQDRLAEPKRLTQAREAEYQDHLSQIESQLATYQTQTEQVKQAANDYQEQIVQLEQALKERSALFETRRQEFEAQRQDRLAQLQTRLNEGQAKLQEANAQLGR